MSEMIHRREFVVTCALAGAGVLAGCVAMVTHPVPVADGRVRLSLDAYPELAKPDGAIRILPAAAADPVYVLAIDGAFRAVSPICTHRGCTVEVQGTRLVCPCHGSTYDRTGQVLRGPAERALTAYPIRREGNVLIIDVGVMRDA
jgi:nitrite reductase/ring-hydroxylating ferredoxin subunit